MDLNEILQKLQTEFKEFASKHQEEVKTLGSATTETKSALDAVRSQMTAIQTQLDAVDQKMAERIVPGREAKGMADMIVEHPDYLAGKERNFSGRKSINMMFDASAFPLSLKTDISTGTIGSATSGVMVPQRLPGLVVMPQQELRIRDVMNVVPQTTGNAFDFVKQSTRTNAASPQVETSPKSQSYYDWATTSGTIRTIAHFVQVSKQALADVPWLRSQIDSELLYGLKLKEELEILAGDGTGVHLHGISTQATAFDTDYLSASDGWTRIDVLRWAKLQARLAGLATYAPSAYVLHPADMAAIELTKDKNGLYVVGDPKTGVEVKFIWGLPVVESDSIAAGTFLTGAFATAATLIDRLQATVDISFEHGDNFVENMATILCEERIGLAVRVPTAFIRGSFSTSPA